MMLLEVSVEFSCWFQISLPLDITFVFVWAFLFFFFSLPVTHTSSLCCVVHCLKQLVGGIGQQDCTCPLILGNWL